MFMSFRLIMLLPVIGDILRNMLPDKVCSFGNVITQIGVTGSGDESILCLLVSAGFGELPCQACIAGKRIIIGEPFNIANFSNEAGTEYRTYAFN